MTFEDYLKEVHMTEHPMLLDDDLPDAFDDWLGDLNADDFIMHGNNYGKKYVKG